MGQRYIRLGGGVPSLREIKELMESRLEAKRMIDPTAELTDQELAEIKDEIMARNEMDTRTKTDPSSIAENRRIMSGENLGD